MTCEVQICDLKWVRHSSRGGYDRLFCEHEKGKTTKERTTLQPVHPKNEEKIDKEKEKKNDERLREKRRTIEICERM